MLKSNMYKIVLSKKHLNKILTISFDCFFCFFAVWFSYYLRLESFITLKNINFVPVAISITLTIPIFWAFGLYRTLHRYAELYIINEIVKASIVYGLIYFFIISIYGVNNVPRSIGIIQPILLFLLIFTSRFIIKYFLINNFYGVDNSINKEHVLIYGAGSAGRRLLISLENNNRYNVVGFLDDNPNLHRKLLFGLKIYNSEEIEYLKSSKNISLVLLAIPSIDKLKKKIILKKLNKHRLIVKSLPNLSELIFNELSISDVKDYTVDDLLDRDPIKPDQNLLLKNTRSKSVLVTGAGGSIGSEICRQVLRLQPRRLILLDLSEASLYQIYEELIKLNKDLEIIPLIGNINDLPKLEIILKTFNVNTIYHTAAYKHVPLVEANICEGVKNNVFGTLTVAKASINQKVDNLVLISSDKAVRPKNIMGASKRLAEICMQGLRQRMDHDDTNFTIVRFGNVINSSGSVIPKFKQQIKEGGPITLTHMDVTRYFMSISEASQLVIQAGALGKNSDIFFLDMGKRLKILDLIKRMVRFSGKTIFESENNNEGIKIKIIGLRPGEKLHEELIIGESLKKTIHPKILKTDDATIPFDLLEQNLNELLILLNNNESNKVKKYLNQIIKLYNPSPKMVDYIHVENEKNNNKENTSN